MVSILTIGVLSVLLPSELLVSSILLISTILWLSPVLIVSLSILLGRRSLLSLSEISWHIGLKHILTHLSSLVDACQLQRTQPRVIPDPLKQYEQFRFGDFSILLDINGGE